MSQLKERVLMLDDYQVVRFFEHFGRQLVAGANTPLDDIRSGIPTTIRTLKEVSQIEDLTPEQAERPLEFSTSAATARNIMVHLANDAEFAPLLGSALDGYRDDELVADVILATGLVASVLLVIATSEFEGTVAGIKFKKTKADPELVRAVAEPFANAISNGIGQVIGRTPRQ